MITWLAVGFRPGAGRLRFGGVGRRQRELSSENGQTDARRGVAGLLLERDHLAEAYAQASRSRVYGRPPVRIGQREVYMPGRERIDRRLPQCTGSLLQCLDPDLPHAPPTRCIRLCRPCSPSGLRALEQAGATDQDSYVVTADFGQNIRSRSATSRTQNTLTLGGQFGAARAPTARPDCPTSRRDRQLTPIEDSGRPAHRQGLKDAAATSGSRTSTRRPGARGRNADQS